MQEHARLAKEWGVPQTMEVEDGSVIRLSNERSEYLGVVDAQCLGLDGQMLLAGDSQILRDRRRLRDGGVIVAVLIANKQGKLQGKPVVTAPGVLDSKEDADILEALQDAIIEQVSQAMEGRKKKSVEDIFQQMSRRAINRVCKQELGKQPMVDIQVRWVA